MGSANSQGTSEREFLSDVCVLSEAVGRGHTIVVRWALPSLDPVLLRCVYLGLPSGDAQNWAFVSYAGMTGTECDAASSRGFCGSAPFSKPFRRCDAARYLLWDWPLIPVDLLMLFLPEPNLCPRGCNSYRLSLLLQIIFAFCSQLPRRRLDAGASAPSPDQTTQLQEGNRVHTVPPLFGKQEGGAEGSLDLLQADQKSRICALLVSLPVGNLYLRSGVKALRNLVFLSCIQGSKQLPLLV